MITVIVIIAVFVIIISYFCHNHNHYHSFCRYELLGQNIVNITELSEPNYVTLEIPPKDRIAVQQGDIIAVLYDEDRVGVTYSLCGGNPEADNAYWYEYMTPETAVVGSVYGFSYSGGSWLCRIFSFRAVVSQVRRL